MSCFFSSVLVWGMTNRGNSNLRNAKVRKVICEITCENCVRKIGKTRKIRLCEIGVSCAAHSMTVGLKTADHRSSMKVWASN